MQLLLSMRECYQMQGDRGGCGIAYSGSAGCCCQAMHQVSKPLARGAHMRLSCPPQFAPADATPARHLQAAKASVANLFSQQRRFSDAEAARVVQAAVEQVGHGGGCT